MLALDKQSCHSSHLLDGKVTSRQKQIADMNRLIDFEKKNSMLLERAGQDYWRDKVDPSDMTTKKTTSERVATLRQLLQQDLAGILKDDEQVYVALARPEFNNKDHLQLAVSVMPSIIAHYKESNHRLVTGEQVADYIEEYVDRYRRTKGLNDNPVDCRSAEAAAAAKQHEDELAREEKELADEVAAVSASSHRDLAVGSGGGQIPRPPRRRHHHHLPLLIPRRPVSVLFQSHPRQSRRLSHRLQAAPRQR